MQLMSNVSRRMKPPTRRALLAFLAGASGAALSFANSMRGAEQEAIAAFLNSLVDDVAPMKRSILFAPDTSTTDEAFSGGEPVQQWLKIEFPEASDAVIDDLARVMSASVQLEISRRLVRTEIRFAIAQKATLARIFERKSLAVAWDAFYKEYPTASGVMRMSRVGIDDESKQALFYWSLVPAGLGGTGNFALLQRRFGVWRVLGSKQVWIS